MAKKPHHKPLDDEQDEKDRQALKKKYRRHNALDSYRDIMPTTRSDRRRNGWPISHSPDDTSF